MALSSGFNQTAPYILWNDRTTSHSETNLTTTPYANFAASNGKLWITATSSDTSKYFSFLVEGGFTSDNIKWKFLKFYSSNITVQIIRSIIDDDHYTAIQYDGSSQTTVTVNSSSHGYLDADCLLEVNPLLTFIITTNDDSRCYKFLFSSINDHPFRCQKLSGTAFSSGEFLNIRCFYISAPYSMLQLGYLAPQVTWDEKLYRFTSDQANDISGVELFTLTGRQWITITSNDTSYTFGFIVEGGFDLENPRWSFEGVVNEAGTTNVVTMIQSGLTLEFNIQTDSGDNRLYNFKLSTNFVPTSGNTYTNRAFVMTKKTGDDFTTFVYGKTFYISNSIF